MRASESTSFLINMYKIKIITDRVSERLEDSVNEWINDNWGNISEVYDVRITSTPPNEDLSYSSYSAVITYEIAHGQ